jgi:AcrR family transcriptional regulator
MHAMPSTPIKRPDAATRRAQLLDAADAVFTRHGVNAPLELIVEHAGVGRATLYRQFPDRHAILLALMERSAERLHAKADSLRQRPDAFFSLLEYLSDRIVSSPSLSDYWRTAKLDDPRVNALRQHLWAAFSPALQRGKDAGLIRPEIQARDISLLSGMLGAALRGSSDAERRRLARQALDIVRRGLLTDASATTPGAGAA